MGQSDSLRPLAGAHRALGAMVLAAVLLWAGWTVWGLTGSTLHERLLAPLVLTPELGAWQLVEGSGELLETGFAIQRPGRRGRLNLAIELPESVDARRFSRIEVQALDQLPSTLTLSWSLSQTFQPIGDRPVALLDTTAGMVELDGERHWRDGIYFLSIDQAGFNSGPWILQSITLHQADAGFAQLQKALWQSLVPSDPWAQRNPHALWPLNALLSVSPVLAITLWAALSMILMLVMGLQRSERLSLWISLPLLIGWLILDVRWQLELNHKVRQTQASFAGQSALERYAGDIDGALFGFLNDLRSNHPRQAFDRVFAFSSSEFPRKRARYHLATWAVREAPASLLTPALSAQLRPGDLILLLDAPEVRTEVDADRVRLSTLDGQFLLTGELLAHRREWWAIKVP